MKTHSNFIYGTASSSDFVYDSNFGCVHSPSGQADWDTARRTCLAMNSDLLNIVDLENGNDHLEQLANTLGSRI